MEDKMMTSADLSEDMMIEILSRLPVKSLLRFKCVCKSWFDLVQNSNFIYKHLKKDDKTQLIVFYVEVDYEDPFSYPTEFFCLFPDETLVDISLKDLDSEIKIRGLIGGPYCGIFCIFGNNNRITLWNLATKEFKTIPKCRATLPRYTKVFRTNVGFGFDPVGNDYKLVLIFTLSNEKTDLFYEISHVAVYTLGTNSWRDFEGFKSIQYRMPWSHDNIYLDGVCYWLFEFKDNNHKVILSFRMDNEVFEEMEGPNIPQSAPMTMGLYDDHLSFLILDATKSCFDIWVLKDRSWTKQVTIGPLIGVCKPLGFWKKGAIFVQSNSDQLLLFEPSTREVKDLGLRSSWFSVYKYKECLITLKGDDDLEFFEIPWSVLGVY